MKAKLVIFGILIGMVIGIVISFLYPQILFQALVFNKNFNEISGYTGDFYSVKGGSYSNALPVVLFFFGLIGGILGLLAIKVRKLF